MVDRLAGPERARVARRREVEQRAPDAGRLGPEDDPVALRHRGPVKPVGLEPGERLRVAVAVAVEGGQVDAGEHLDVVAERRILQAEVG
ncbi:hypothetical protein PN416_08530 [Halorubrum ezzemoulense]|uniref:hypothetical protein n=1 Tax=Halorubrum ezzemoulense TaxID=337243 RepID=UPI0023311D99|nr:hypothetical protein [Halorubrum ezzemoulense]MDB9279557.1 hypothetical protein [Halorubrum ezzemoulense]MDB9283488.1 hypothetical protein [Halorubrum ezzemoulense]